MKAIVSSKGQMVIPREVRRRLSIEPGTELEITVLQAGEFRAHVIRQMSGRAAAIRFDKRTGCPVLKDATAPRLTSELVRTLLDEFP
jgi:AbrB family looped-hinge helix DNA binding protein